MKTFFSLAVVLLTFSMMLTLGGCDSPQKGFESRQASCTAPGNCHVTRMPRDNELGYVVRP
jgi:hypothetical protein